MTTLNLSLPEPMREFLEAQAASAGYEKVDDYVLALIHEAQKREAQKALEAKLLEGLEGEPKEMAPEDWQDIRRQVRERLEQEKRA